MAKTKAKKKKKFVDDGRTIVSMNFDHSGNIIHPHRRNTDENRKGVENLNITNRERWAMIKAMYLKLIPILVISFISFFLIFLFLSFFWM